MVKLALLIAPLLLALVVVIAVKRGRVRFYPYRMRRYNLRRWAAGIGQVKNSSIFAASFQA
jgi:hypothetical protein